MSNKYSQKFFDSAKKSTTDGIKITSKREIQKQALKIKYHNKITSASKNNSSTDENEIETPKERDMSKYNKFVRQCIKPTI